jgi:hypothetical protein
MIAPGIGLPSPVSSVRAQGNGGDMKRVVQTTAILMVIVAVISTVGCWPFGNGDKLCCEEYSPESQEATYCNGHRDAVLEFVREVADTNERRTRLNRFETFYETIKDCGTVDCIENGIAATANFDAFANRYQQEHGYVETETTIAADRKAALILCGFRHAIAGLKKTL